MSGREADDIRERRRQGGQWRGDERERDFLREELDGQKRRGQYEAGKGERRSEPRERYRADAPCKEN